MLVSVVIFIICLGLFLLSLCWFLSMKCGEDREKSSPYECGFDGLLSARSPFSLRFFLVAVMFVVFDVEVVLFVPIVYSFWFFKSAMTMLMSSLFLLILFLGLFHEYREGSLEWVD
uniref:NADH-ubiquinone oxidoreductase chain 3 n=1 Tax=Mytilisepta keenae TaxID=2590091 RepID=A0A516EZD5_9BIVA|nr:NADH dehydrogenase subunit 3 [Mytilisepta keenae]QDO71864.1 NADH dehydrogenase subunit 3 [Mytilisepta keenae]